ncbi:ribonuclease III [Oceanomicrobium pacificus]|uniref:Ribonuclease 3 n=1 Tax=Oceanomicrobium pacificus TaxID=2692916 RepID=A0A6B0THR8_9RHOB|nr:ribonuclease III [Oceanomicrobium pacificus]MXU63957.1 ribonuclease III [Oceanomicrobium pacificus]
MARLGHEFTSPDLLREALTHASLSAPTRASNQRLEFLGDRVLGLIVAEALLKADPEASEGELAPRLNALVRKETCAAVAEAIALGDFLMMGRSEMLSGGRRKTAILGDAMEAVIAAIYLDAGMERTRKLVLKLWEPHLKGVEGRARDPKTALQEWAQSRSMPPPEYVVVDRSGPDHKPNFTIEVRLRDGSSARATAASKRAAQQSAAKSLLAVKETEHG